MGQQQQQQEGGVKVKFIETQFVSSDAASFKAVVQRLTGKSAPLPPPATATRPNRPLARVVATAPAPAATYAGMTSHFAAPVKQEIGGAGFPAARLEDLHELCDFGDLLYNGGGARRVDGAAGYGGGFPY
uniref:VQ domain-containing protein n=1 Tax=Leersia perrieri TaxID=77586 RepID=A0A0D9WQV8_9ORYZ